MNGSKYSRRRQRHLELNEKLYGVVGERDKAKTALNKLTVPDITTLFASNLQLSSTYLNNKLAESASKYESGIIEKQVNNAREM